MACDVSTKCELVHTRSKKEQSLDPQRWSRLIRRRASPRARGFLPAAATGNRSEGGKKTRVRVGPQTHRARRITDPKPANDTRLADPAMDLAAELGKLRGHQIGGAPFLEPEFGMSMNVAPQARQIVVNLRDAVYDLHGGSSSVFTLSECRPRHE
jgi:hypothetical protein